MEKDKIFATVKQFSEMNKGKWPSTEGTIRAIILNASLGKNNFQKAFKRFGKRVLINVEEFWRCVERESE